MNLAFPPALCDAIFRPKHQVNCDQYSGNRHGTKTQGSGVTVSAKPMGKPLTRVFGIDTVNGVWKNQKPVSGEVPSAASFHDSGSLHANDPIPLRSRNDFQRTATAVRRRTEHSVRSFVFRIA